MSVTQTTNEDGDLPMQDLPRCSHIPVCPPREAVDRTAAIIISDHLQDCGYALLCNGLILLEGDDVLTVPDQRRKDPVARSA